MLLTDLIEEHPAAPYVFHPKDITVGAGQSERERVREKGNGVDGRTEEWAVE